jgi:hypothetical protein
VILVNCNKDELAWVGSDFHPKAAIVELRLSSIERMVFTNT